MYSHPAFHLHMVFGCYRDDLRPAGNHINAWHKERVTNPYTLPRYPDLNTIGVDGVDVDNAAR